MLIKKIELFNFRQFRGKVTLEFAEDIKKNVTVIMGDNGSGKTTFAQAFTWCLYGENEFKKKELINRQVREAMDAGDIAKVEVGLFVTVEGKDYRILRRQKIQKAYKRWEVKEEEFFVEFQNEETSQTEYLKDQKANTFVKNMLPKELSKFFFFDGERIRTMSDEVEKGKSSEFASAVQGLIGLTSMRNAIEHLSDKASKKGVVWFYENEVKKSSGTEYQKWADKITEIDGIIEGNQERLRELEDQIEKYWKTAGEKDKEIKDMSSAVELKKQYDEKEEELKKLESERQSEIERLIVQFSQKAKYYLMMPLAKDSLEELAKAPKIEKGIPRLYSKTLNYLLERKECICGEPLVPGDPHFERICHLLDIVPPKTIGQSVKEYTDVIKADTEVITTFYMDYLANIKSISEKNEKIASTNQWLREKYEELADTSKAKILKEQKIQAEKAARSLEAERTRLNQENGKLSSDRGYAEMQRDKHMNLNQQNRTNRRLLAYARLVYEDILKEYESKETATRMELENTINNIFRDIYENGIQLSVDEKYNIRVSINEISEIEDELERNTAQNYAIIFAFISGIIKMSKDKRAELNELYGIEATEESEKTAGYPLVMDAPLSAFDKRRIENICETIPDIAQQVVIFIKDTDGEVAESYMSQRIGKRYMLVADSQTETHVEGR